MKRDALSNLERAHIILELDKRNKWTGVRMGATVEMLRVRAIPTRGPDRIYYSVVLAGDLVVSARADTVGQAVDDINQIIHGHPPQLSARAVQCAGAE